MPQGNAILDCSPIAAAGHVIPQSYVPISVSQFMDDLSAEEDVLCSRSDNTYVSSIFKQLIFFGKFWPEGLGGGREYLNSDLRFMRRSPYLIVLPLGVFKQLILN